MPLVSVTGSRPVVLVLGQAGAVSGGDMHAFRLAEAWHGSGADVKLIGSPDLPDFLRRGSRSIAVTLTTPFDRRMSRSGGWLTIGLAARGIKAIRHCRGASIVVAGSHLIFDVGTAVAAHLFMRKPVATYVYHVIGDMDRPPTTRTRIANWLEGLSFRLLKRIGAVVFVDNDDAWVSLVRRGFSPDKLHRTGNAYDPDFSVPSHAPVFPGRLLFIGRLVEQKGVWDVIDLGRRLKRAGSSLHIDLVGEGPLREHLDAVVEREDLQNVHILGLIDEQEKWRLLTTSVLFLAPSREEGWGIAVGEALLAGVPVIARDLPAYGHFPSHVVRVVQDGSDFVDAALALTEDPREIAEMTERTRLVHDELPRWEAIISDEIAVLRTLERSNWSRDDRR